MHIHLDVTLSHAHFREFQIKLKMMVAKNATKQTVHVQKKRFFSNVFKTKKIHTIKIAKEIDLLSYFHGYLEKWHVNNIWVIFFKVKSENAHLTRENF